MPKKNRGKSGRIPSVRPKGPPPPLPPVAQDPPVERADPPVQRLGGNHFWPEGEPLPEIWVKVRARSLPCPACRRVRLPNGGQAVACQGSGDLMAYFRCRSCGHRWGLPVQQVG